MSRFLAGLVFVFQMVWPAAAQPAPAASGKAAAAAKATVKTAAPATDIFSGTVTAYVPGSLTVVRKVPARADESRVFVVDQDTKIEGNLKVDARVTVRFKTGDDGTVHAQRVIVRADAKASPAKGRTGQ